MVTISQPLLEKNPSFVWRSIWESQRLVRDGARWKIGSGELVNTVGEPWLPDPHPYITTDPQGLLGHQVFNLMTTGSHRWDRELLSYMLDDRDRELVLRIPLNYSTRDDQIIWSKEVSGVYTVKSAYNLLQQQKENWNLDETNQFWHKFWKARVPPKMKDFIWRACSDCLPTRAQLRLKHVEVPLECPICQKESESTMHALLTCPVASWIWARTGIGTDIGSNTNFFQWLQSRFSVESRANQELTIAICWSIWCTRNEWVWSAKRTNAQQTISSALHNLKIWQDAQAQSSDSLASSLCSEDGANCWVPPAVGTFKINVDGAVFEEATSFGMGLMARNHLGLLIEGRTMLGAGQISSETVEAISIREALTWIRENCWQNVSLETDCLVAVQAIRSELVMSSLFGDVIRDCKSMLKVLTHTKVIFVKRSANKVAHSFARASLSYPDRYFGLGDVPTELLPCLVTEFEG